VIIEDEWLLINTLLPKAGCSTMSTDRVLFYGPPGTGKTMAGRTQGLLPDQKVFSLTLHEESVADEVRGMFLPNGAAFEWFDGPGTEAWRIGARVCFDEIDRASGAMLSLLLGYLDDPEVAQMKLPNKEIIKPHPNFSVVATMNGELEDLPAALRDRFPVAIRVKTPNPDAIARLDHDVQQAAKNTAVAPDEDRRVSVRIWKAFCKLRKTNDEDFALSVCFQGRAQEVRDALHVARSS
jgi:MoxR-like ATPase